ncbi:MAG: branched-chain amino acid ABC transporter ATP-binding protein [Latescibacteria bacterium DG_63]|nr:MAG: branched-chain amino acid ABC transporter ATP-binding protein [Latescibacteria bacterium DG_63]
MLSLNDVHVHYGAIHALKGITVQVDAGKIVSLIGANGAGKSTILRTISGLSRPTEGNVLFLEKELSTVSPHDIVRLGISHVPEGRIIFANLTVLDNLELGAYVRKASAEIGRDMERVFKLFPRLKDRRKQNAGTLSGGEQQMLAIGRALMSAPKLLLMDEPSLGLAPILVRDIFQTICEIRERGTTILLVEQNARMALSVADEGYVLETGKIVLHDKAEELLHNEQVRQAYLGG